MAAKYKVIVAHPDDEIVFFSSVLKDASKVVICFGPSVDKIVSDRRQHLKTQLPLSDILFLDIPESDVFNSANWKRPVKCREGIVVGNNEIAYQQNYDSLKDQLAQILDHGETIYTHNPWGEYGHEEHVQVFRAITELSIDLNLEVFVNCYVSNKSYLLMTQEQHLLSGEVYLGIPDVNLCSNFKNIYQANQCWTWDDDYSWPKSELFCKLILDATCSKHVSARTSTPPINMLSGNYRTNKLRLAFGNILPTGIKSLLKRLLTEA